MRLVWMHMWLRGADASSGRETHVHLHPPITLTNKYWRPPPHRKREREGEREGERDYPHSCFPPRLPDSPGCRLPSSSDGPLQPTRGTSTYHSRYKHLPPSSAHRSPPSPPKKLSMSHDSHHPPIVPASTHAVYKASAIHPPIHHSPSSTLHPIAPTPTPPTPPRGQTQLATVRPLPKSATKDTTEHCHTATLPSLHFAGLGSTGGGRLFLCA